MERTTLFREAMDACFRNGDRLLLEVRDLLDWSRPQSALVLAVIAQEEFAKGFFSTLWMQDWCPGIRSCNVPVAITPVSTCSAS